MRLTLVVEGNPAIVNAIVQRHRAFRKLFDHQWAHLVVLEFRSGEFFHYEPGGRWRRVPAAQPVHVG